MKEGLWKRFKSACRLIIVDTLNFERSRRQMYDSFDVVTFRIELSVPIGYEKGFNVLFRWIKTKFNKAIKEVRNE